MTMSFPALSTYLNLNLNLNIRHLLVSTLFFSAITADAVSQEYTDDKAFQDAILSVTNTYRAQHNASALVWDQELAEYAQEWGDSCEFGHSGGPYGENLASGYESASAAVVAWGEERDNYDFDKGKFSPATGHFTALVWKSTTTLGCSQTLCNTDSAPGFYVVCEYNPAGNVIGQFNENVGKQVDGDGVLDDDDVPDSSGEGDGDEGDGDGAEDEDEEGDDAEGGAGRLGGQLGLGWTVVWVVVGVVLGAQEFLG